MSVVKTGGLVKDPQSREKTTRETTVRQCRT